MTTAIEGSIVDIFTVTVDYNRTLLQMIQAGKYDHADHEINAEHFPIVYDMGEYEVSIVTHDAETAKLFQPPQKGKWKVELEVILVHFNRNISSDDAIKEMDQLGLRPAVLPELLAFGEMHPAVQKDFPIVALGSVWLLGGGNRRVPGLDRWVAERELHLFYFVGDWLGGYRFAAVRK